MTVRTGERLKSAADRASGKEAEIAELEDELAADLARIAEEARGLAAGVEKVPIGLEKSDLSVREIAIVWIPKEA
jgi:hypothetical protein